MSGVKRTAGENAPSGVVKKVKTEDLEITLRILLQSKSAGGIIGKGGQNIKRLRTDYNATVTVPDSNSSERVLSIQAPQETAIKVLKECLPLVGMPPHSGNSGSGPKNPVDYEIDFLVHSSQVGSIIGKGGQRIKELRTNTGALIKVFSDCLPHSTERVVAIGGNADDIGSALEAVLEMMAETPIKGPIGLYDPGMIDEFPMGFPAQPFGGPGGPGLFGRGGRGGMRGRGSRGGRGGGQGRGGLSSLGAARGPGGEGPSSLAGFSQDMGNGGNFTDFQSGDNADSSTTQVTIPKDLAGAIIGKGGERIRNIRQRSAADIKIDEPLPDMKDRIITITGNQDQIHYAQFLMQQSVRMYSGKKF